MWPATFVMFTFGHTPQSMFSSGLLIQVSRMVLVDSTFSLIRNHIHSVMPDCLLWEAFYYSYCSNSLELLCLALNALIQNSVSQFLQVSVRIFYCSYMYNTLSIKLGSHTCFYIVSLNTTMFLFLLYHLSKRDTMPRTRCSKYKESIVTILNVLGSLSLSFRSPDLTGIHQFCPPPPPPRKT